MSNEIQTIVKWFKDAKPSPTIEDISVQIGCGYEETAERASGFADGYLHEMLVKVSHEYKANNQRYVDVIRNFDKPRKVEILDSMCDEIVTRIGEAYMLGFDIIGALNEVIASNDSKRMPDGSFPLDENGKITKESPNFFKPDLSKFINKG